MFTYFVEGGAVIVKGNHLNDAVYASGMRWITGNGVQLIFQTDGNLVLYSNHEEPVWSSQTYQPNGAYLRLRYRGVLEILSLSGDVIWRVGDIEQEGSYLAIQPDGNLVLYNCEGEPIWNTGTQIQ